MFTYAPSRDFLKDKTILVTGASDGIGAVLVRELARHGANVVMLGRTEDKLVGVYDDIEASYPGKAFMHLIDFATAAAEEYQALAEALEQNFPALDGLVHNAATLGTRTPIQYFPEKDWQQVMQVNVNAVFYLTRALVPAMTRSKDARMLFVSSSVGRVGRAYWGAYGVSKFALEGLMQTLAQELETTTAIRVNSVNPGATRTPMRARAYPAENPQSRPEPIDLMPVYLYLFSDEAQPIHGQAIDVQGFDPKDYLQSE